MSTSLSERDEEWLSHWKECRRDLFRFSSCEKETCAHGVGGGVGEGDQGEGWAMMRAEELGDDEGQLGD